VFPQFSGFIRQTTSTWESTLLQFFKSAEALTILTCVLGGFRLKSHLGQGLSCRIWGFHSGGFEEYHLLGYDAVCLLAGLLNYSSTLKMEAILPSETSGTTLRTARRHIPEDDTLQGLSWLTFLEVNLHTNTTIIPWNRPRSFCHQLFWIHWMLFSSHNVIAVYGIASLNNLPKFPTFTFLDGGLWDDRPCQGFGEIMSLHPQGDSTKLY
jgi:hypothetical protein